jgi:hypothetical protein
MTKVTSKSTFSLLFLSPNATVSRHKIISVVALHLLALGGGPVGRNMKCGDGFEKRL